MLKMGKIISLKEVECEVARAFYSLIFFFSFFDCFKLIFGSGLYGSEP